MATRYEYYITGDDNHQNIYPNYWMGQTFTPAVAHKITSVKLLLFRAGSGALPGTVTVAIQGVDGSNHPDGSDLCSGTTNGNTLPTSAPYEWREITLGAGADLAASTMYAIVVKALEGDSDNYIRWRMDDGGGYAGGAEEWSNDNGSSWSTQSGDFMFEEWGEPAIQEFEQAVGQASLAIVGALSRKKEFFRAMGSGAIAIAGALSPISYHIKAVGEGAVNIAGAVVGEIVAIAQTVGEGSIAIAGSLLKYTKTTVGEGAVGLAGHASKKLFQTCGQALLDIRGYVSKKTSIAVGEGATAIAGTLVAGLFIAKAVGQGAISIAGSLVTDHIVPTIGKALKIVAITAQYRKVNVITAMYRKIKGFTAKRGG